MSDFCRECREEIFEDEPGYVTKEGVFCNSTCHASHTSPPREPDCDCGLHQKCAAPHICAAMINAGMME